MTDTTNTSTQTSAEVAPQITSLTGANKAVPPSSTQLPFQEQPTEHNTTQPQDKTQDTGGQRVDANVKVDIPKAEQSGDTYSFEATGNDVLDYALKYVGTRGFGPEHPAMVAAAEGNFDFIRAELAALGDKAPGYDAVIAMAEKAFAEETKQAAAAAAEVITIAHTVAGGEDNWNTVKAWAASNATETERASINAMFAQGGMAARAAVTLLVNLYTQSNTLSKTPAPAVKAAAAPVQSSANAPMTAREYSAAVQELQLKYRGADVSNTPEYAQLQRRRIAGQRANI